MYVCTYLEIPLRAPAKGGVPLTSAHVRQVSIQILLAFLCFWLYYDVRITKLPIL